jgi:hypothetical protein
MNERNDSGYNAQLLSFPGDSVKKVYETPYTLKLEHPFQWGEHEKKTELVFTRRLKGKDMKGIQTNSIKMDDMMVMLSRLTGEARTVIEELDGEDLFAATEVLNSFLPHGPASGEA